MLKKHPTINRRGWDEPLISTLVEHKIIKGDLNDELKLNEENLIEFIEYHNQFYENRTLALRDNISILRKNKEIKKNSLPKK